MAMTPSPHSKRFRRPEKETKLQNPLIYNSQVPAVILGTSNLAPSSSVDLDFGWAWLPSHLLDSIVERLVVFSDFMRLLSVCKPWRSNALEPPVGITINPQPGQRRQLYLQSLHFVKTWRNNIRSPMLMTPTKENCDHKRNLYDVNKGGVVHEIQFSNMPSTKRCCGSSHGWLITIDGSITSWMVITLTNPFLDKAIDPFQIKFKGLRPAFKKHDYIIRKAILLSDPRQDAQGKYDCEVFLLYGVMGMLAHLNASETLKPFDIRVVFVDIISYKGQVYAVSYYADLVRIDIKTGAYAIVIEGRMNDFFGTSYLVESHEGDLLLVRREFGGEDNVDREDYTCRFEVFKLSEEGSIWKPIDRIGNQALFLGDNSSMCISTLDFPGFKPNCIYYVDHYYKVYGYFKPRDGDQEDDTGFYNMEDKSFKRHYTPDPNSHRPTVPSVWIVPNFTS